MEIGECPEILRSKLRNVRKHTCARGGTVHFSRGFSFGVAPAAGPTGRQALVRGRAGPRGAARGRAKLAPPGSFRQFSTEKEGKCEISNFFLP